MVLYKQYVSLKIDDISLLASDRQIDELFIAQNNSYNVISLIAYSDFFQTTSGWITFTLYGYSDDEISFRNCKYMSSTTSSHFY